MSYILEALKKAERQRELGQVPGIGSLQEASHRGPSQRWPWVLAVVLILNAVIIGALFWPVQGPENTLMPSGTVPSDPGARQPASSPPIQPTQPPVPKVAAATEDEASKARPITNSDSSPISSRNASAEARPLIPLPLPQDPPKAPQPAGSEKPSASLLPERWHPPAPAPQHPPVPAPRDPPAPAPKHQQLPVWPMVANDLLQQINAALAVNVHVYSENPENRYVFVNMKIYRVGDQLLEGPKLEEITKEGVVLSFRGERFRVLAE
jgi:general secretion pathway protein B